MSRYRSEGSGNGVTIAIVLILVAAVVYGIYLGIVYRRVDPGEVGVLVKYKTGTTDASLATYEQIPTGSWVKVNWWKQALARYPISQQSLTMVKSTEEGQVQGDDSTKCQDEKAIPLWIDSTTLWRVDPTKAGELYLLRPGMPLINNPGADIESTVVRREVRNAITVACSEYSYASIFLGGRETFRARVEEVLSGNLEHNFILLDGFLPGEIHLPPEQEAAINQKVVAQQQAEQAAYAKQKAENEAAGAVATAEGQKKVKILQAQAEAEYIKIVNEQLGNSPLYIKYVYASKWDGVLPMTLVMSDGQEFPLLGAIPLDAGVQDIPTVP